MGQKDYLWMDTSYKLDQDQAKINAQPTFEQLDVRHINDFSTD
jgi:hypothetical protein